MTKKLLRRNEVEKVTGLKRSSIYSKIKEGDFPKPIKLGMRAVAWLEADVMQWIESKVTESRGL
ncbi:MAG: helix-turn-helix transcriptional regulator [Deferribacterales bacterium]